MYFSSPLLSFNTWGNEDSGHSAAKSTMEKSKHHLWKSTTFEWMMASYILMAVLYQRQCGTWPLFFPLSINMMERQKVETVELRTLRHNSSTTSKKTYLLKGWWRICCILTTKCMVSLICACSFSVGQILAVLQGAQTILLVTIMMLQLMNMVS